MNFHNASFKAAYGTSEQLPASTGPEVSFAGRSNVGKSSLLNKLMYRKGLAKVSSTPGKTATINFYDVDGHDLVDLPGYGYAKVSKAEKGRWSELIEGYYNQDRDFALVVSLIDIRHEPSPEDREMFQWTLHAGVPFTVVATKADKIGKSQRMIAANKAAKLLGAPAFAIPFSAEERIGKDALVERIGQIYEDAAKQAVLTAETELLFASAAEAFAEAEVAFAEEQKEEVEVAVEAEVKKETVRDPSLWA